MHPSFTAILATFVLAGCTSIGQHPAAAKTPPYSYPAGKKCPITTEDISAAVAAARHSKYFPGKEVHLAMIESRDEIHVDYGDVAGISVVVRRVHGHWQAVDTMVWNS